MSDVFVESELEFSFPEGTATKFDINSPYGLKAVDFIVDTEEKLYLIEVKNYEQSRAPEANRKRDFEMLTASGAVFSSDIGGKLKDSLLRKYAAGDEFTKPVVFLLMLHMKRLEPKERSTLFEKVNGHIPIGLNGDEFPKFTEIKFDLVDIESIGEKYGFYVSIIT